MDITMIHKNGLIDVFNETWMEVDLFDQIIWIQPQSNILCWKILDSIRWCSHKCLRTPNSISNIFECKRSIISSFFSLVVNGQSRNRMSCFTIKSDSKMCIKPSSGYLVGGAITILKNISQIGWLFPIYGKHVPNHQVVIKW